ncbi:MAG: hypothetical protein ABL995_15805 [Bryobacteraceae bacterium]
MSAGTKPSFDRSVLFLDPDPFDSRQLLDGLHGSRWKLTTARDLQHAETLLRQGDYLVVIASLENCARIRTILDNCGCRAKIIAAVAFGEEIGPGGNVPSWPFAIVRKPYNPNEVCQTLNFAWAAWRHLTTFGIRSLVA